MDLRECRREISMLAEECNALKSVMKGQEGEMQREINNLIIKLKGQCFFINYLLFLNLNIVAVIK